MDNNPDMFAVFETVHFLGLSLLVGSLLVMDLRALGYIKRVSYAATLKLTPVAVVGLGTQMMSGAMLFSNNPALYTTNTAFWWKVVFVFIASVNAGWFVLVEHHRAGTHPTDVAPGLSVKIPAAISLVSWAIVIVLGRLLPSFATIGGG
jgi:hypothetical protein